MCECRDRLWDMITIQQQNCYCDMLTLNSYIFCYINKPILKWHIIMLTLKNYVIFTICQSNILCHFNIFTVQGDCYSISITHSLFGCLLYYNSLLFNPILLSFGRGSFLCLVHPHSNFQLIRPCSLCDIDVNSWFFLFMQIQLYNFYQGWVKLHNSAVSYSINF